MRIATPPASRLSAHLDIQPEVAQALKDNVPVVALESTIIAHGMPYPRNVETARSLESIIRREGAIPATIGIIKGRIKIGLSPDQLESFGRALNVHKVSRRDFPYIISQALDGATTVAGTMICAGLAGIPLFVTGGIGGVHRGGAASMDISADLLELARTNVAVVCAGAKSILDLGRTLEVLETHGVPVIGFATDKFPAFYARSSGYGVDCRLDSPREVACLLKTKWDLQLEGGVVIAAPVPEAHAMAASAIERHINSVLALADSQGVQGKALTPFLLAKLEELTGGESLRTNIALVQNNARIGALIAKALAELTTKHGH